MITRTQLTAIFQLRSYLSILLLVLLTPVFSQTYPIFKSISRTDGLTSNRVYDIIQDRSGFIWIATENGLNKYDGNEFKQYSAESSKFEITKLFLDRAGNLWVCSLGGDIYVYQYYSDDFKSLNTADDKSFNSVNVIYEDWEGILWIGTDKGLFSYDPGISPEGLAKQKLAKYPPLNGQDVTDLLPNSANELWVSTFGNGLLLFDTETYQLTVPEKRTGSTSLGVDFIYDMEYLDSVNLFLGTSGSGLLTYNTRTRIVDSYSLGECLDDNGIVRTILKDSKDQVWVGTDGKGLIKIQSSGQLEPNVSCFSKQAGTPNTISGNAIYRVFEDRDNNIWIGTAWDGLNILPKELKGVEMVSVGPKSCPVLSINSMSGRIWFGTDGQGLSVSGDRDLLDWERKLVSLVDGTYVQCIYLDSKGLVWIGTFANGLLKFDTATHQSIWINTDASGPMSLTRDDVRGVIEDSLGNYWVSTAGGGLNYIDLNSQQVTNFSHQENDPCSIGNNNIQSFIMSRDGTLWLATYGGGLDYFDPGSGCFKHFVFSPDDSATINSDHVSSLLDDGVGNLWIGTRDGLCKMDLETKSVTRIQGNGMSYGVVTSILADNFGDIWVSTRSGIHKFDISKDRFWHLTQLNEGYHLNASYKGPGGKLLFGGMMGVTSYDPEELFQDEKVHLPIVITDLQLFNESIKSQDASPTLDSGHKYSDLTFEYYESVITFDFSALHYPSSSKIQYQVKMDNFDQSWRSIGTQRSATYTNLSPGEYQFRVRANLPGQAEFSESTPVNVVILAPIWKRWWAYAIYTVVFVVVLLMIIRYTQVLEKMKGDLKVEKVKREQETNLHNMKQRFFTNISHEIRTPVTLLLGATSSLAKKTVPGSEDRQKFSIIHSNGKRLLKLVNELLDLRKLERKKVALKIEQVDLVAYAHDIFLSFNHRAQNRNINYRFNTCADCIPVWIDRDEMEKVLYNLLSNAFKHSHKGGKVTLSIQENKSEVELSVRDTGKGIPVQHLNKVFQRFYHIGIENDDAKNGFGLGLAITQEIINQHGGEISVSSTAGKGSRFNVKLKKGNTHFPATSILASHTDEENPYPQSFSQSMVKNLKGAHLLVVDDNNDIRDYLRQLFEYEFQITVAENGSQGWELTLNQQPDLVISDVVMPELDGIAFTKKLKENPMTSHIPIILLTARGSHDYHRYSLEIGADDFITKPFDEDLLKARVVNLLNNRNLVKEKLQNELILKPKEITVSSPDQKFLAKLIEILDHNIGVGEFSVSDLSKKLGMSHSIVYKKIKALTGYNMVEFIRDYRLKKAAKLLSTGDVTVKEACYAVGFSDRKYFGAIFKKKFGCSPSVYRKSPTKKTDITRIP